MDTFRKVADHARKVRTVAATLPLVEEYAKLGCATYRVDTTLFREVFGDGAPAGYAFNEACDDAWTPCLTVARTVPEEEMREGLRMLLNLWEAGGQELVEAFLGATKEKEK